MKYAYILEQLSKHYDGDRFITASVTEDEAVAIRWRDSSTRYVIRTAHPIPLVDSFDGARLALLY